MLCDGCRVLKGPGFESWWCLTLKPISGICLCECIPRWPKPSLLTSTLTLLWPALLWPALLWSAQPWLALLWPALTLHPSILTLLPRVLAMIWSIPILLLGAQTLVQPCPKCSTTLLWPLSGGTNLLQSILALPGHSDRATIIQEQGWNAQTAHSKENFTQWGC